MRLYPDPSSQPSGDNRRVALIKSSTTKNRFYVLVTLESGLRNAEIIEKIPDELLLGIAYPCLEDGLNDFAVIRTTYETLDFFPDDDAMRSELMEIVNEARSNLIRRLAELSDRISVQKAHFLGTDLEEFKSYALDIVHRGYPRRNLDSMMKLNVFGSVADTEGDGDLMYRYEFRNSNLVPELSRLPARAFVAALFKDVLDSVTDDENYMNRYSFDRNVFQKFIALMFVNYATTDPIFYGTNQADYGVSDDKNMDATPLYMAVARELREIEVELSGSETALSEKEIAFPVPVSEPDSGFVEITTDVPVTEPFVGGTPGIYDVPKTESTDQKQPTIELPGMLVNEDALLSPIASLCAAAQQLCKKTDHDTVEFARIILAEASRLVKELKRLNIVSPFAYDPGETNSPSNKPKNEG